MNTIIEKIVQKINHNLDYPNVKGMVIASPSDFPPYKYHWIRDSALVMRVYVHLYEKKKSNEAFVRIINYINNEFNIQNMDTLTFLGEPKMNINLTPFNGPWGRPQNDGSALRGSLMIKILNILKEDYNIIVEKIVSKIIKKDIEYILSCFNKPCFDLWEEITGWHFYTRMVQLKFIKDCITNKEILQKYFILPKGIEEIYHSFRENIKDHIDKKTIISSFDEYGNIIRKEDASILLAFAHIDYDSEILKDFPLFYILDTSRKLINAFTEKYGSNKSHLIGRYKGDKYFDGQIWLLCSLGLAQVYNKLYLSNQEKYKNLGCIPKQIYNFIINIDENLDLPEQYNINTKEHLSAKNLTWNYSELYITYFNLNIK